MSDNNKHMPTPWKVVRSTVRQDSNNNLIAVCYSGPRVEALKQEGANAAHIVHCVNTHDELVEALEQCLARINPKSKDTWDLKAIYVATEALKKATN